MSLNISSRNTRFKWLIYPIAFYGLLFLAACNKKGVHEIGFQALFDSKKFASSTVIFYGYVGAETHVWSPYMRIVFKDEDSYYSSTTKQSVILFFDRLEDPPLPENELVAHYCRITGELDYLQPPKQEEWTNKIKKGVLFPQVDVIEVDRCVSLIKKTHNNEKE